MAAIKELSGVGMSLKRSCRQPRQQPMPYVLTQRAMLAEAPGGHSAHCHSCNALLRGLRAKQ